MKLLIAILLLCTCFEASSQELKGKVINGLTKYPISGATVTTASFVTFSQVNGYFSLRKSQHGDTLKISCVGYKPYKIALDQQFGPDTLLITLQPQQMLLNQVVIRGSRNYKSDSLKNRDSYGSAFNHKTSILKDVFISPSSTVYTPYSYNEAPNNTTQLLSVNILSLIALAGKNKTPVSRFQKTLLRDEEARYVGHIFSKEKVSSLTALRGDSFQAFIDIYRPTSEQLKKLSDYDLMIYIKHKYFEFIKTHHHANTSPFNK